jgi:hypothetical protein
MPCAIHPSSHHQLTSRGPCADVRSKVRAVVKVHGMDNLTVGDVHDPSLLPWFQEVRLLSFVCRPPARRLMDPAMSVHCRRSRRSSLRVTSRRF